MQYFNFSGLIEQYAADVTAVVESKGYYDDYGEYVSGEKSKQTIHGAILSFSESKIYRSEGNLTAQDKLLLTEEPISDALLKAEIIHHNRKYKIEEMLENAEFTGVYQYTLKYISAFNGDGKKDD